MAEVDSTDHILSESEQQQDAEPLTEGIPIKTFITPRVAKPRIVFV